MKLNLLALVLGLTLASALCTEICGGIAHAQNEESEEARQASEKAKRRHYPGGRDEQELTVQAVIPQPTRYPQDPKPEAAGAKKQQEAPSDEGHD